MLILDVSNNNAEPRWEQIRRQGVSAVFLKATEGTSFVDKTFSERRAAARRAGLHVGAYHFARPDESSGAEQGKVFSGVVGKLGSADLRPVLDLEVSSSHTPAQLDAWAREFNAEVKKKLGVVPLFYTYSAYIEMLRPSWPIGSGLWLASYSRNDGVEHPYVVPHPWHGVVAHQFTSQCRVTGCEKPVDMSNANKLRPLLAHPVRHAVRRALPYRGRH